MAALVTDAHSGLPRRLSVLLVDDHVLVREGTRVILDRDPALDVVAEAATGAEAVRLAAQLHPDVVVLDIGLPGMNGLEATRRIRAMARPPRVLVLTAHDDIDYVLSAVEAGVSGYLLKTSRAADVIAAIWACSGGEMVLQPAIVRRLAGIERQRRSGVILSHREVEVLDLAAAGMTTKEIACQLGLSTRTVEAHFTSAFNKLGAVNRTEAIARAGARGLLHLTDAALVQADA
jgi:DNA-binding NarL/FixJ family response regulator